LGISTPVTLRHIRVLEKANLVTRKKVGRSHILALNLHVIKNLRKSLTFLNEDETVVKVERNLSFTKLMEKRNFTFMKLMANS